MFTSWQRDCVVITTLQSVHSSRKSNAQLKNPDCPSVNSLAIRLFSIYVYQSRATPLSGLGANGICIPCRALPRDICYWMLYFNLIHHRRFMPRQVLQSGTIACSHFSFFLIFIHYITTTVCNIMARWSILIDTVL